MNSTSRESLQAGSTNHGTRIAAVLGVLMLVSIIGAALLAVLSFDAVRGQEDGWAGFIVEKGPVKVMRRWIAVLALVMVPWFLKVSGWGGRSDCGWSGDPGDRIDPGWKGRLLTGLGLGLASLGAVSLGSYLVGNRVVVSNDWLDLARHVVAYAISAGVVALVEETVVRGILYRVLERCWGLWPAALISSVLFSLGHFLQPDPATFEGEGVLARVAAVLASGLSYPLRIDDFLPRFLSMTLMGIVLCLTVWQTRSIWLAVGLHAGWVWIMRMSSIAGDTTSRATGFLWFGGHSDTTDGYLTALVLGGIAAAIYFISRGTPQDADLET